MAVIEKTCIFANEKTNKNTKAMTAKEKALVKEQTENLLKLLLKKTNTKYRDLIEIAEQEFIADNIGILTPAEKKQFNMLVF